MKWNRRELMNAGLWTTASMLTGLPAQASEDPVIHRVDEARSSSADTARRFEVCLNDDWRFALGHASDPMADFGFGQAAREDTFAKSGSISPAKVDFDDRSWQSVVIPHDWAVALPLVADKPWPEHGARPLGREYPGTSIGWYRRKLDVKPEYRGRRVLLRFDGIFRNAQIFLNGRYLDTNWSGYATYEADISAWLDFAGDNVLTVRVDASIGEGWFYEGAGIYRSVYLIITDSIHLVPWGTFVRAIPDGSGAKVEISTEVANDTTASEALSVEWIITDKRGRAFVRSTSSIQRLNGGETALFRSEMRLADASLWSPDHPTLYSLEVALSTRIANIDNESIRFGVRSANFDAKRGFLLNGKRVQIKGVCCHQDHAGVGSALPDRLQWFRLERLKEMGANALRTSHNPPAPGLLEAADHLGLMIMCETRTMDCSPEGVSQLTRMVRRFRNHPSIILWSLGNEEPQQKTDVGARVAQRMKAIVKKLDPSRFVTFAMLTNIPFSKGAPPFMDLFGFNYGEKGVDAYHAAFPEMPCVGSEVGSSVSTRGVYQDDKEKGYISAYDIHPQAWSSTAESWWSFYDERQWLAGGFVWTGFDYRGEPTPYEWPCVSSHFGLMDLCGFPKDNYFYYKAWWRDEPMIHLFPHWTWPEDRIGKEIEVWCHTNLPNVELFVNGTSQGVRRVKKNGHAQWTVLYSPGVLEAVGHSPSGELISDRHHTTGAPHAVCLVGDRRSISTSFHDVAVVTLEIRDSSDRIVPVAMHQLHIDVSGPGQLIGTGNGDPSCHDPEQTLDRRCFNGLAQAIIRPLGEEGTIVVRATGVGLKSGILEIPVVKFTHKNHLCSPWDV